jgi:hypothetical protein
LNERHPAGGGPEEHIVGGASGRGFLLLAVAVVLGIVVLQATDQNTGGSNTTKTTSPAATSTTQPSSATTTHALRPPAEVKVLPANGTAVSGLGARVGTTLKQAGYTNTLSATDANSKNVQTSVVEFSPDFDQEAVAVAAVLGLPQSAVRAATSPSPVSDTRGANVVVIIGQDLAKSSPTTAGGAATTTTVR